MAQPPIEVDQISAAPAFDGTNITNVDAASLGGSGAGTFAPLASPAFTGTVTATDENIMNTAGDSVLGIQAADPGGSGFARLLLKSFGGGTAGSLIFNDGTNAVQLGAVSGDLALTVSNSGNDITITTHPLNLDNIVLDGQRFPNQDGSVGQVLQTNGTGTLSWVTPPSGGVMFTGTSGIINSPVVEGATRYSSPSGRAVGQAIESASVREIVPYQPSGPAVVTVSNLFVKAFNNTTTSPVTVTLFKNGVATAVVATIGAGSTTVASDIANSFTCTPNDGISMRWTSAGAGGIFGISSWGFTVT